MRSVRLAAWAAPVLALLVLPQLAAAGPVEWDYLANFHTDGDRPLRLGSVLGPDGYLDVVTGLRGEDLEAPGSGSQRIRIGSLLDIDATTVDSIESNAREQWLSDLTITDRASGQSGQVTIGGRGVYLGDDLLLNRRVMLELIDGESGGRRELVLGGNRYEIVYSVVQGDGGRISTLVADVTVTANTPEPGTLALAGLGLGGLGLVRRRRGRTAAE